MDDFLLDWEEVSGRNDPRARFSLYRLCDCQTCEGTGKVETIRGDALATRGVDRCRVCRGEGKVRELLATVGTPQAVGVALVTLAREGEWIDSDGQPCALGLLDRAGQKGKRWLILPWLPSPRNASDAGKLLRSRRKIRARRKQ